MTAPTVSIVVVSRHRATLLKRCLTALSQLIYPAYEVVVVADPGGLSAIAPFSDRVKTVSFDVPNISAARNVGIAHAAGEIVAFIDDDSVPEPTWLTELVKGFAIDHVAAVGGFVRGRNGISFQWKAGAVDNTGTRTEIPFSKQPFVPRLPAGQIAKLEGTNMAIRRDVLLDLGGFDHAFHYYLDETDLCLRLASAGHAIAFAPNAEVHHGFAENVTRSADRAPKSLFQLGASKVVFLRKHANSAEIESVLDQFRSAQRTRLLRYLMFGMIEPRDVARLLNTLEDGFTDGHKRPIEPLVIGAQKHDFRLFQGIDRAQSVSLKGRVWQRARLRRQAYALLGEGKIVTVFLLGPSFRRHHVRFEMPGIWVQSGGLWGRSDRAESLKIMRGFSQRVLAEIRRCSRQRALSDAN